MRPFSADPKVIRFGPFEADLRAGELRERGRRLKLEGKPFQVLAALLRRPGELVTRDELQTELWTADTFVEFDHSLNTAVNKVRAALGDSARDPKFIETLHRRGYRFIGEITPGEERAADDSVRERPTPNQPPRQSSGNRSVVAIAAVSATLGIALGAYLTERAHQPLPFRAPTALAVEPAPSVPLPEASEPPVPASRPSVHAAEPAPRRPTEDPPAVAVVRPDVVYAQRIKTAIGWVTAEESRLKQLVWVDRTGQRLALVGDMLPSIMYPELSPDERSVAATVGFDVWVQNIHEGTKTRLSAGVTRDVLPLWSPVDDSILYSTQSYGGRNVYLRAADASQDVRRLAEQSLGPNVIVFDWSRDGEHIVYRQENAKTKADIGYLRRVDGGSGYEQIPFLQTPAGEGEPKLSPDGRFIAYCSDESGRAEIYVSTFPSEGPKFQASTGGGTQPRWSRDGSELFYVKGDALMVLPAASNDEGLLSLGRAEQLFRHQGLYSPWRSQQYDVSADGERFLVVEKVASLRADAADQPESVSFD